MAIGDIGSVQQTFEFDTVQAKYPSIIHVSGDIYLITYEGSPYDGKMLTVEITAAGVITTPPEDTWTYSASAVYRNFPAILHAAGTIYLQATRNNGDSSVVSFNITDAGVITKSFINTMVLSTSQYRYFDLIHIDSAVFAVIYQDATSLGQMTTFSCAANGVLTAIATVQMSDGLAFEHNRIIKLADNYFVMCYRHTTTGRIVVANVTDGGAITRTDIQVFHTGSGFTGYCPCQKVADGIVVVAFGGTGGDGYIQTIAINATGTVTNLTVDSYEFETTEGRVSDLITIGSNYFAVIYYDTDGHGHIKTFYIDDAGSITKPFKDTLEFDTVGFTDGRIAPFQSEGCLIVVYDGVAHDGFIKTIDVESPIAEAIKHTMIMGIGP